MFLTCVLPVIAGGQTVPPGATEEATRIIDAWKEKAETDPAWFKHQWAMTDSETDFSAVTLEDPYVLYMMQPHHLVRYLDSTDPDLVSSAQLLCFGFPVVNKGQLIGTLLVIENRAGDGKKILEQFGEYVRYGQNPAGTMPERRIRELRAQFPKDEGYVICGLNTTDAGDFVLVRREGRTEFITACDRLSGEALGLEEGREKGRFPVITFDEAVPALRRAAEEHRAWLESPSAERIREYIKTLSPREED
jgi:hypothetical protein